MPRQRFFDLLEHNYIDFVEIAQRTSAIGQVKKGFVKETQFVCTIVVWELVFSLGIALNGKKQQLGNDGLYGAPQLSV